MSQPHRIAGKPVAMSQNYRILHVDNDSDMRLVVEMATLLDTDMTIRSVASGAAALDLCLEQQARPDILMLDYRLPDMSGADLLRRLRRDPAFAKMPVIFLTDSAGHEAEEEMRVLDPAGILNKPFNPLSLAIDIRLMADRWSAMH
ncbi:response regulator [Sphingobium sp. MK2]|uniref:response regulator n=1 Tax=Sphingobium sp. MK2 TaxID=3116540 RepID=UPI0032E3595D